MEDQALLALDECCRTLLLPALETCSDLRGDQHYRELSLRLALLEAVLWLDVGVALGAFDAGFTQSVLLKIKPSLDEQFGRLPDELKARLPKIPLARAGQILNRAELPKSFELKNPNALLGRFQVILGLVARLNSDLGAANTTAALTILRHSAWESFLSLPLSGEDLKRALDGGFDPWMVGYASIAKAGCFSLIEYFDAVLNVLRFDRMPEGVRDEDWIEFRRLVAWVASVRFDFGNSEFTERLEKLIATVGHTALLELRVLGVEAESNGWSEFARMLVSSWRDLSFPRGKSAVG
jgi:hypothetical protein